MKRLLLIVLIGAMASLFAGIDFSVCLAEEGMYDHDMHKGICRICGMYIERFKTTAVFVDYKDGSQQSYCGVSCAIRAINEHGGLDVVKSARVTGWLTEQPVEMKEATYVIGSSVIPDMLPNIIAFSSKEEASHFIKDKGGKIELLDVLLVNTSYRGMTMPFRIPSAAVPSQGVFNYGTGVNAKLSDGLIRGDDSITDTEAFKTRTMIMDKMIMYTVTQTMGYGFTDDLFCSVAIPYAKKKMITIKKSDGSTAQTDKEGTGDIALTSRWRFWHDMNFDKHAGLLGAVTIPSGDYDSALRGSPNVQLGNGAPGFTLGPLYSQHIGKFWFHIAGMYKWNLENSDDYKYGDCFTYGFALHYLPNSSDLLGFEFDGETTYKNEYKSIKVLNTGRRALYYNFVYQKRVFLLLGGNINVSGLIGFPAYEKVREIQLGEQYHAAVTIQWQRKF